MTSQSVTVSTSCDTAYTDTWLKHIHALAGRIGPRGSTTEGERRGHEYCRDTLKDLGLEAKWDDFRSAKSVFHPFLIVSVIMLLAFAIYPLAGRTSAIIAALIALATFISALLELNLLDNPLSQLVPKGQSQNVIKRLTRRKQREREG